MNMKTAVIIQVSNSFFIQAPRVKDIIVKINMNFRLKTTKRTDFYVRTKNKKYLLNNEKEPKLFGRKLVYTTTKQ